MTTPPPNLPDRDQRPDPGAASRTEAARPQGTAQDPAGGAMAAGVAAPDGAVRPAALSNGALSNGDVPPDSAVPMDPRDELPIHLPALRAFAISLTRDVPSADDLVQETILKAWGNFDKFQTGSNLRAWLFTILRNTFYSSRRKHRREVPDTDGLHAARLSEKPAHDGRLALNDFRKAFDQLSPEHREVLILVGASGFSYDEAAVTMGVAVGTVKSRANRARARLTELLGLAEGEDPGMLTDGITLAVTGG